MGAAGQASRPDALGAYGLRLTGLADVGRLLVPVPATAPAYRIAAELGHAPSPHEFVDDDRAELRLRNGGQIVIERGAAEIRFRVPYDVHPEELAHPYLAPAAAVIGRWHGRESMHAGAVAVDGRALGIVGEREAGKSSTLAWLARSGVQVLCDDMVILDEGAVLAGPRSVDLRQDAAERLGTGESIGVAGARERWRVELGPVPARVPLTGWVFLGWGERAGVRALPASERLGRLAEQRGVRLPPVRPDALLELTSLPAWELTRPRGWESLPRAADLLVELA